MTCTRNTPGTVLSAVVPEYLGALETDLFLNLPIGHEAWSNAGR